MLENEFFKLLLCVEIDILCCVEDQNYLNSFNLVIFGWQEIWGSGIGRETDRQTNKLIVEQDLWREQVEDILTTQNDVVNLKRHSKQSKCVRMTDVSVMSEK